MTLCFLVSVTRWMVDSTPRKRTREVMQFVWKDLDKDDHGTQVDLLSLSTRVEVDMPTDMSICARETKRPRDQKTHRQRET